MLKIEQPNQTSERNSRKKEVSEKSILFTKQTRFHDTKRNAAKKYFLKENKRMGTGSQQLVDTTYERTFLDSLSSSIEAEFKEINDC